MRFYLACLSALAFVPMPGVADEPGAEVVKQTTIDISPETTRIVAPLDKRGFVDYVLAANQLTSAGVTPDNNFEVVARNVVGTKLFPQAMLKAYFQGLQTPIPRGPFLVSYFDFCANIPGKNRAAARADFFHVIENPWTEKDYPEVAAWLRSQQDSMNKLVQASERTHQYTPYIDGENAGDEKLPRMLTLLLPSAQEQRNIARLLLARAYQNIASADLDAAWLDILATMRIGRLTAQGITVIESLIGIAIDSVAFDAAVLVLKSPELTDEQAERMLDEVKKLPHLPSMSEKIDAGERYAALDVVQMLSAQKDLIGALTMLKTLAAIDESPARRQDVSATTLVMFQNPAAQPDVQNNMTANVNWNVTAKLVNQWIDRLVIATAEQNYQKRHALLKSFESDLNDVGEKVRANAGQFGDRSRDELGQLMGETLVSLLLPSSQIGDPQIAAAERLDVLRLAFAAEVYKRKQGEYPKQLQELVPTYCPEIPADRFSDQPLQYRAAQSGFVVYSVGRNNRNDLGRNHADIGDRKAVTWDDIVVRIKK